MIRNVDMGKAFAKFDQRKALHAMLFVVTHLPKPANVYNVLKCLYYADRKHLQEYGRQIYGETFYALEHGPVPSAAYEIIKYANGRAKWDLRSTCSRKETVVGSRPLFPAARTSPATAHSALE